MTCFQGEDSFASGHGGGRGKVAWNTLFFFFAEYAKAKNFA